MLLLPSVYKVSEYFYNIKKPPFDMPRKVIYSRISKSKGGFSIKIKVLNM